MNRSEIVEARQQRDARVSGFFNVALRDTEARLKKAGPEAQARAFLGLSKRFKRYIDEGEDIAEQTASDDGQDFIRRRNAFLDTTVRGVGCPDGRVLKLAIFDFGDRLHKRLGAEPETRKSTRDGSSVLRDPTITASMDTHVHQRKLQDQQTEFVEFLIPHGDIENPAHGCGYALSKAQSRGEDAHRSVMRYSGIREYIDDLGDGIQAFDNVARSVGANSSTFIMFHDANRQNIIFGAEEVYKDKGRDMFDPDLTLRENFLKLQKQKEILMTEFLDRSIVSDIKLFADKFGIKNKLNMRDPEAFLTNALAIGNIAMLVTQLHESRMLDIVPKKLAEGKSFKALRTLLYIAIRNRTYTELGGITPDDNSLKDHPEELVRAGSMGYVDNVGTIPFIQATPPGLFRPQDFEGIKLLYGLSKKYMPALKGDLKADFEREALVFVIAGRRNPKKNISSQDEYEEKAGIDYVIKENTAEVREIFKEEVNDGRVVVIGARFNRRTRMMEDVLETLPYRQI